MLKAFLIRKIKTSDLCYGPFVIVGGIMNKYTVSFFYYPKLKESR